MLTLHLKISAKASSMLAGFILCFPGDGGSSTHMSHTISSFIDYIHKRLLFFTTLPESHALISWLSQAAVSQGVTNYTHTGI